ncbi:rhomboid-related protein 2-like [Octopus sinensis]|uniref:Rhomboid-related protein 2-like n=1 Tax=Octopus sinensis TaxID=2607531 RepID=A0A6P7T4Q4_9MOLL|nr:rhomboid-related protein 2-like [Octopus sinensis]
MPRRIFDNDEEIALQSEIQRELDRKYKPIFDEHGPQGIPLKDLREEMLNTGITSHVPKRQFDKMLAKANSNKDSYINYKEFVTLMAGEDALLSRNKVKVSGVVEAAIVSIVPIRKQKDFLANYTCCPPPVFMFLVTLAEIAVFVYYVLELKKKDIEVTWSTGVPICSPLIYSPYDRKEAWRYISYMFIHQGYLHLIFNCIFQIILGIPLEFVHKFWRLFLVYMLGVLAGSMAHSVTDRFSFLGGASGGCYALIGAHLAAVIVNWKEMNYKCWDGSFLRMLLSAPVRLIVILTLVFTDTGSAIYRRYTTTGGTKVGISAHIGGMLAGLLLGVPVMKNINELPWERTLGLVTAVIYVIFTMIAVLINILYHDYPDPNLNPC